MMYTAFPIAIAAMLLYMFWHTSFSMRRDRITGQRLASRRRLLPQRVRSRRTVK